MNGRVAMSQYSLSRRPMDDGPRRQYVFLRLVRHGDGSEEADAAEEFRHLCPFDLVLYLDLRTSAACLRELSEAFLLQELDAQVGGRNRGG